MMVVGKDMSQTLRARPTKSESYLALGAEEWRGRDSLEGQLAPNVCR